MKNILVTLDFEEKATVLIDMAAKLAEKFGSKIWLVHIAQPEPDFVGYDIGPQYIRDTRAEELKREHKLLQGYAANLKAKKIDSESLLIEGGTIGMLMDESKKLKIDLIVSGNHKHGFLYNAFIGSVSAEIIKKSKIPVLLIPLEH